MYRLALLYRLNVRIDDLVELEWGRRADYTGPGKWAVLDTVTGTHPDLREMLKNMKLKSPELREALHESLSRRYRKVAIPKPKLGLSAKLDDLIEFRVFPGLRSASVPLGKGERTGLQGLLNKIHLRRTELLTEKAKPPGTLVKNPRPLLEILSKRMVGRDPFAYSAKSDLIQFEKKLYVPGEQDEPPTELPKFTEGESIDYTVQRHAAERAGLHRDIRIGTKRHGLLSWATRKDLPGEGGKIAIHPQPIHSHEYLGWEGDIPSGQYGAGKVSTEELGKALVTKSEPDQVNISVGRSRRLALLKTRLGHLLVREKHPEPPTATKPDYKSLAPEKVPESLADLPEGTVVQPKVDGALVYVKSHKGKLEVFSHRKSKEGHPILHTERFFKGRPAGDLEGKTILGELYGTREGRAIEPQELGGILNAHIGKSLEKQSEQNVDLKIMPFDIEDKGNYPQRLAKLKYLVNRKLPKEKFTLPEEATTAEDALDLHRTIAAGEHPLTKEGIIIHPPEGKMIKVKNTEEANVEITGTFPGTGKFEGAPGGFTYEGGRVGTGFTDETRRQLEDYIGRQARIRHQGRYKSGAYRAPSFIAVEENK